MRLYIVLLIALLLVFGNCGVNKKKEIVVGSKNFTESIILAELLAQRIEAATQLPVTRKFNLGGTNLCHQALISGQLDLYPEYTGTALVAILNKPPEKDAKLVYQAVRDEYQKQFKVTASDPFGFNNTFAILIRGEDARKLNIKNVSEAAKYAPEWRPGFGYEFVGRADGFPGFVSTYGLKFKESPKEMDLALTYRALADRQVDLIAGNSTDGMISELDLYMLTDDKQYFPPYEAVALIRQDLFERNPAIKEAINKLSGKISNEEMRNLNHQVDIEKKDIAQVVKDFREKKQL